MIRHKGLKAALAATLAVAGAVGFSQSAMADVLVSIDHLSTPNDYGYLAGGLDWMSGTDVSDWGYLHDTAADGHGPYYHAIAAEDNGANYQFDYAHNTNGDPSYIGVGGEDNYTGTGNIEWVDMWNCNGGTVNGYGVEGGCYGRRYWNQVLYPGRGSSSLGTTTGAVY